MGFDWETILGSENPEEFEDLFSGDISDFECFDPYGSCGYYDEEEPEKPEKPYNKQDYAHGLFEGKQISFRRSFATHTFRDDEVKELLKGNTISVSYETRKGRPRTTNGHLQLVTSPAGRPYYGFIPQFDKRYVT